VESWIRIAHRGASGRAPENTLAAFKKAIDIGVDAVELDLHGTADGEVVVIHDASLDRTTNHRGPVNQATLETIKRADAGGWFATEFAGEPVPTLTEALECIAEKTVAVLEIKDPLIAEAVVTKVRETQTLNLTVIISFHTAVLQTVRALEPRIPTGWLIGSHNTPVSPEQLCQQLGELGSSLLNVNHQLITAEFAYEVRRRGIALWCWTVDDVVRMREMKAFGVQGITSNYPERFAEV
jgi:glycerophosphoryl diester phosphodiesterase